MKWWIQLLALGVIVLLNGCASYLVLMGNGSPLGRSEPLIGTWDREKLVFKDNIIAMGVPQHHTSGVVSDPNLVAFVGLKNTYVLTRGGDALKQLIETLDKQYIQINDDKPTRFYIHEKTDDKGNTVRAMSGYLLVGYNKTAAETTAHEKAQLEQLGFELTCAYRCKERTWGKGIETRGYIYPPAKNLTEIQTQFTQNHPVKFYKIVSHSKPDVVRIAALPFAVAFDVVTFPVQFLMFK